MPARLHLIKGEGLSGRAVVRTVVLTPGGSAAVDGPLFRLDFNNYCGPTSGARFVARLPGDPRRIPITMAASGDYPFTSVQCLDPKATLVSDVYPFAAEGSGVT